MSATILPFSLEPSGNRSAKVVVKTSLASSLHKLSRTQNRALQASKGALLFRQNSYECYREQLYIHRYLWLALEKKLAIHDGQFVLQNWCTQESKHLDMSRSLRLLLAGKVRSQELYNDIKRLPITELNINKQISPKIKNFLQYIDRLHEIYPAALLGVVYCLEESAAFIAPHLLKEFAKQRSAMPCQFLRSVTERRSLLSIFRSTLNSIEDFQTQVNILTAATLSYELYQEQFQLMPTNKVIRLFN